MYIYSKGLGSSSRDATFPEIISAVQTTANPKPKKCRHFGDRCTILHNSVSSQANNAAQRRAQSRHSPSAIGSRFFTASRRCLLRNNGRLLHNTDVCQCYSRKLESSQRCCNSTTL